MVWPKEILTETGRAMQSVLEGYHDTDYALSMQRVMLEIMRVKY
jgi:hypothetical protein